MRCAPQEAGAVENTACGRFYFEDLAQVNDSAATVLESMSALGGLGMPTDFVFLQVIPDHSGPCRGRKHSCCSAGGAWVLLMHGNWHAARNQRRQFLPAGRQPSEEPRFYSPGRPAAASGKAVVLILSLSLAHLKCGSYPDPCSVLF